MNIDDEQGPVSSCGQVPAVGLVSKKQRAPNRAMPIIDGMRICRKCGINKNIDNFPVMKKKAKREGYSWEGHVGQCRDCFRKWNTAGAIRRYRANPLKFRKTPAENHKATLSQKYGITVDQYNSMLSSQNGGCAICGSKQGDRSGRRLCVDHDHTTGKVRALLCMGCNAGIGNLGDNANRLRLAASYLDKFNTGE